VIQTIFEAVFGTSSSRHHKRVQPLIERINSLEPEIQKLSDEQLKAKTAEFKARVQESLAALEGEFEAEQQTKAETGVLDEILPEAFACVREAGRRAIGLRHFDVQMLGGIVLHHGKISEMRTGEGKTLVATLPAYLNALMGRGVHVVTVNDYLAKRDSQWMGPVFEKLGLTVGFIQHDMPNPERRDMYGRDITYVTNNEIGFDYLRDNMVIRKDDRVLRPLYFAIVDEVDSILIDEARTPLIISGPSEESTDRYAIVDRIIPYLKVRMITEEEEIQSKYTGEDLSKGYDAIVDEKAHTATLTKDGIAKCENLLQVGNLYDDLQGEWVHHITQALRAHHLYKRDVEYLVKDGEVIIIDEFTGRLMPGRRWSEGLHQAVEAKEKLPVKAENQTLATITFQNFFKLYKKVGGMTGTAMTEAEEFGDIYKLDVVEIPTNRTNARQDMPDQVYRTEREKWNAIVIAIDELWRKGRPVLVGTRSVEKSEKLAAMLRTKGIPHQVLNAKYHEMEATIVAQAGKKGTVTIATNMAGRGTDIVLGGNPADEPDQKKVVELGGLHVLGTERHEARRIDNQLSGRCGRQGDPGSVQFYLALDDELMRLFGADRVSGLMQRLGMEEGEVIESTLVSRQIRGAQKRWESENFNIRKQLVDYDNVMNKQREVVYALRNQILDGADVSAQVQQMLEEALDEKVMLWCPKEEIPEKWELDSLVAYLTRAFGVEWGVHADEIQRLDQAVVREELLEKIRAAYDSRASEFTGSGFNFQELERMVLLQMIDTAWKNHLYDLDHLKKGISLRAYAQKDPLIEYQLESFNLFEAMMNRVREQTVEYLFRVEAPKPPTRREPPPAVIEGRGQGDGRTKQAAKPKPQAQAQVAKVNQLGRNDPCFCGSGKKYKKCHGS
jgi:preprotein translocase subunit SecA